MIYIDDAAKAELKKAVEGKEDDPVVRVYFAGYG